jgi:coenzyme F420-reducing hydrogenase delta subunit
MHGPDGMPAIGLENVDLKFVSMACSSMVKDVFLLRAFEAGADAVIVLVCPEGKCRHVEGNIRAKKRVAWVKDLLDEIGLDGRRLSLFNISENDKGNVVQIIRDTAGALDELGPNPAG